LNTLDERMNERLVKLQTSAKELNDTLQKLRTEEQRVIQQIVGHNGAISEIEALLKDPEECITEVVNEN